MQGGGRQGSVRWRRGLTEEEKMLELEIIEKVQGVRCKEDEEDKWDWSRNGYSVKEAYSSIIEGYVAEDSSELADVWNDLIPLKVSVLVWRLMQNRIPTKDNLVKRGVLTESQKLCSFGCGKEENASHVFYECKLAAEVWQQVLKWLNISSALQNTALSNFLQFKGLIASGRVRTDRFSVIWYACIWILWKGRNEKIFKDKNGSLETWLEGIKLLSWKWLTCKLHGFKYNFNHWSLNPMDCLGIKIT
jgi:hypothetical protein